MINAEDTSPAAAVAVPAEPPVSMVRVLRAVARRDLAMAWLAGVGMILALVLGLGVVRCLIDFWVQLDWNVRAVFLFIDLILVGLIVRRWLWRAWKRRLSVKGAALRLERVFPVLGSRVIAALQLPGQLERGNLSAELVGVVVRDADAALARLPWREAAPGRAARRWLGIFAGIAAVAAGLYALQPETAAVLARRWLLSHEAPVTRTKLALSQTDLRIALGKAAELGATASGAVPKQAIFEIKPDTGDARAFPVEAVPEKPGVFNLKIDNVRQSFNYRVRAGDARSPWYEVETLPAPALLNVRFVVHPPAYTGLADMHVAPGEEIVAPAGSVVHVDGRSSLPIKSAEAIVWKEAKSETGLPPVPLKLGADALAFSGEVTLAAPAAALTIPLEATNGVNSQDDTRNPIRVIPVAAPVVDLLVAPPDNESDTADAVVRIRGRATDDYGISRLALCWEITVPQGKPETGRRELNVPPKPSRRVDFAVTVAPGIAPAAAPEAIALSTVPGASVVWWLEAADNAPTPNLFSSPRRTLHVVTPDEKLTIMMARLREGMGELDDVGRSQERVNDSLGRLLPSNSVSKPKSTP